MGGLGDRKHGQDESTSIYGDSPADSSPLEPAEQSLLDAVLRETLGQPNHAALELVFEVARASQYPDTSQVGAVEEFVHAVLFRRFPSRRFSRRLVYRIACSLVEAPEATVKLERLWQEARTGG